MEIIAIITKKTYSTAISFYKMNKNIDLLLFGSCKKCHDYKRPDNIKFLFQK